MEKMGNENIGGSADSMMENYFKSRQDFAEKRETEGPDIDLESLSNNEAGGEKTPEQKDVKSPGIADDDNESMEDFLSRIAGEGVESDGDLNINGTDDMKTYSPENYNKLLKMHTDAQKEIKKLRSSKGQEMIPGLGMGGMMPGLMPGMLPGGNSGIPGLNPMMGLGQFPGMVQTPTPKPTPKQKIDRGKIESIIKKYSPNAEAADVDMFAEILSSSTGEDTAEAHNETDPMVGMQIKQNILLNAFPDFGQNLNTMVEILEENGALPYHVNMFKMAPMSLPISTLFYLGKMATEKQITQKVESQFRALLKKADPELTRRLINDVKKASSASGGAGTGIQQSMKGGSGKPQKLSDLISPEKIQKLSKKDFKRLQKYAVNRGFLG